MWWMLVVLAGCGEATCETVELATGCEAALCCSDADDACWLEAEAERYACEAPDELGADCGPAADALVAAECPVAVPLEEPPCFDGADRDPSDRLCTEA